MSGRELTDRCSLALAVLEGEKDANKILADLLEDSGQRGLAQWARARKGKLRKRLDFVLAVLPYEVVVQLACDFVDHLGATRLTSMGKRLVKATRDLLDRKQPTDQWIAWTQGWHILPQEERLSRERLPRPVGNCLTSLWLLGQKALTVIWHDQQHEPKATAQAATEVQAEACRVARLAREAAGLRQESPGWAYNATTPHSDPHELQWQIEHTKLALQAVLQKGIEGEATAPEAPSQRN
jgi:hypothetical protein